MQGFKCIVTDATSTAPLSKAQPPVMCTDDSSQCVQGAKQMIVWNQLTGNNIQTTGSDTPAYNTRCGWSPGAQNDIFEGALNSINSSSSVSTSSPATSAGTISFSTTSSTVTQVQISTAETLTSTQTEARPSTSVSPLASSTAVLPPPSLPLSIPPLRTTLSTVAMLAFSSTSVASSASASPWRARPRPSKYECYAEYGDDSEWVTGFSCSLS